MIATQICLQSQSENLFLPYFHVYFIFFFLFITAFSVLYRCRIHISYSPPVCHFAIEIDFFQKTRQDNNNSNNSNNNGVAAAAAAAAQGNGKVLVLAHIHTLHYKSIVQNVFSVFLYGDAYKRIIIIHSSHMFVCLFV